VYVQLEFAAPPCLPWPTGPHARTPNEPPLFSPSPPALPRCPHPSAECGACAAERCLCVPAWRGARWVGGGWVGRWVGRGRAKGSCGCCVGHGERLRHALLNCSVPLAMNRRELSLGFGSLNASTPKAVTPTLHRLARCSFLAGSVEGTGVVRTATEEGMEGSGEAEVQWGPGLGQPGASAMPKVSPQMIILWPGSALPLDQRS